jgi:glucose/arabinose dehydrogenase
MHTKLRKTCTPLASAVTLGFMASSMALAQQTPAPSPAAPPAPPSWAQGRAAGQDKSPLAPHNAPLTAKKAEEIPLDKIKVPDGFQVELWASGMPNARSMTLGEKGTLFVGTRLVGRVFAVVDKDGKREVKTIAQGLHRSNGVAFKDGALYVAELSRVLRYDDIENKLDNPPEPKVVYEDLPKDEPHGWKFIAFGPDGMLYVPIGAPCNICDPSPAHAQIRRIKPDGSGAEVVARGVRNTVGFDWHPQTRELWFTDNGRDWLTNEQPEEELNRVTKAGQHFGFPVCHSGDILDPEFAKGKSCEGFEPPVALLGPHAAALGMRFYTANMFPPQYRNSIFVARHGSWNRDRKEGFDVLHVTLPEKGAPLVERFAHGWLEGDNFWGRVADVQVMRDGSLLVSDDWNGAIYRISYKR